MAQSTENTLICPICQHANPLGVLRCEQCGIALTTNTTTMRITDEQVERALGDLEIEAPAPRQAVAEGLVFYIAGEVQPLIVRGKDQIVLGRHVEGQTTPDVLDMTPYHGHLLGVSRRHARVIVGPTECLLEDLNSTNGTWLNEKRLTPNTSYILSNGDQIRLGQCILFVYFSMPSPRQNVTIKRSLSASALLEAPTIPALDLAEEAVPYLRALVALQAALDSIHLRSAEQRTVVELAINGGEASVEAALSGLADAVSIVQQVVIPWQKRYFTLLVPLWKGESAPPAPEPVPADGAAPDAAVTEAPPSAAVEEVGPAESALEALVGRLNGEVTEEVPAEIVADLLRRTDTAQLRSEAEMTESASVDGEPDLAAAERLLLENTLRHIKSELYALDAGDHTLQEALRPAVLALCHSPLEIVRSSY